MRSPIFSTLLLLAPLADSVGQAPRGALVPVGARVKTETQPSGKTFEATVLAWSGDSVVLLAYAPSDMYGDTVRLSAASINSLRVEESPSLWRYIPTTDINFYSDVVVPRPKDVEPASADDFRHVLVVATQNEFVGIDAVSGTVIWARKDLPNLGGLALDIVGRTGYGVITRGDTMEIIDLATGARRWDTKALSLSSARGWLPLPGEDTLILMYGRTARSRSSLMAVELGTGNVRWRQDSLFQNEPKVFGTQGVSYLLGHQSPLLDTDTTLVLYISKEGALRLHARTGALLWRADVLHDAIIPAVRDGYASISHSRGLLFIPSGLRLLALHAADGRAAWDAPRTFKSQVTWMYRARSGLVVRGDDWVDLLDPLTGKSVWRAPVQLKNSTRIVLRGDTAYVAADKKVLAIQIPDGSVRTLTTVNFRSGERPGGFSVFDEGIVLNSWHNLALVDRQGAMRYERYFPSPGESFLEGLSRGVGGGDTWRPTTHWGGAYVYFFTGAPDEAGRLGFSIVKIDPAQGRELGRLWLDDRDPFYFLGWSSGTVYYKRNAREITALKFADWTALAHAARNGYAALVERLLAMGVGVNTVGEDGWTALHLAANGGHSDVVNLLLRRGADVNARTGGGWTAWMLAARQGHTDIAQILREAGAGYSDTTAALLRGWRLATQDQITEALAAYAEAEAMDSTLAFLPAAWADLCWHGSLAGKPAEVMPTCEKAVERAAPSDPLYPSARFARGVARALTADLEGAAADLEPSLDPEADEEDGGDVQEWIDALRAGRNPFTPAVLESLRQR